jgi:hypothetical protein
MIIGSPVPVVPVVLVIAGNRPAAEFFLLAVFSHQATNQARCNVFQNALANVCMADFKQFNGLCSGSAFVLCADLCGNLLAGLRFDKLHNGWVFPHLVDLCY